MPDVMIRGRRISFFPARGLVRLGVSILLIIAGLILLDRKIIPSMEDRWKVSAFGWERENKKINHNNGIRNRADETNWVWRSNGHPVQEQKSAATRILVMGDSFVWGSGTANMNDTWWRMLAREVRRRGYGQVEVIAAGLGGMNTRQQLEQARVLVPRYKPDLIIWGYVANDADEGHVSQIRMLLQIDHLEKGFVLLDRYMGPVLPNVDVVLQELRQRKRETSLSGPDLGYEYADWELKLLEGGNFRRYKRTVADLGRFQAETGLPAFVMSLPTWPSRAYFEPRFGPVKPLFDAAGVPFYDILSAFVAAHPDEKANQENILRWGITPANGHPGPLSAHFYAVQAADILESHYRDSLGQKSPNPKPAPVRFNDWMPTSMKVRGEKAMHFTYPADERDLMYMPLRRPFVQFNLESPASLREIRLSGPTLTKASVWITTEDPSLHYDPGVIHALGEREGSSLTWSLEGLAGAVNTIRISASFKGTDRTIDTTLVTRGAKK